MRELASLTAQPLREYAARLHGTLAPDHHIASPLGAWMLLGLVARAGRLVPGSAAADAVERALGCPLEVAAAATETLLRDPHPAVRATAVAWLRHLDSAPAGIRRYLADLPCESGEMPSQAQADAWAQRVTDGLIEHYPADLDQPPPVTFTMATALLTRVAWYEPFDVVAASELGPGPFAHSLNRAMQARVGRGHRAMIVASPIGPVAVHEAVADGLVVTSVAADPAVPAAEVIDAAYAIAAGRPQAVSLWDLPLGDGPAWTITEGREPAHGERGERILDVTVPAWSAQDTHDLLRLPGKGGFAAAGQLLAPLLGRTEFDTEAAQAVAARYHRTGFEAAAITALAVRGAALPPRQEVPVRTARLRFGHPYAVVAVAELPHKLPASATAWLGLPVFSGWVAKVEEPTDD